MKKRIVSLTLAAVMLLSAVPFASAAFADVPAGAWYAESVNKAYELGLVRGISETEFNPEGSITLAETIALACRLHSGYYGSDEAFVQGDVWYQVYVDYATQNNIIKENAFDDFNRSATRLQFAEIFAAALPKEALKAINKISLGQIPDVAKNAAVYLLYNAGVLTGSDEAGTFLPSTAIKRSEVAAIVTRMADESLRKTFTLTKKEDKKEDLSAWDELTKDDAANFSTFLVVYNGFNDYMEQAKAYLDTLQGAEEPVTAEAAALCRSYLSTCYAHLEVLVLNCEKHDDLREAGSLAELAMEQLQRFLDAPLPDNDTDPSYYVDRYADCMDTISTIAAHLDDEVKSLSATHS